MSEQIEMPEEFTAPRGAGAQLRLAREKAGLSVADVAARTRISQRHILDLEAGNYAAFPSRAYPLGFARSIAKQLGIDAESVAAQVRSEMGMLQPEERTRQGYEPGDPARVPSSSLVWVSLAAAGLLLAGLFMAYRTFFSPAAELPSLVEQQEAEQAEAAAAARAQAAASPAAATAGGPVVFTASQDGLWVRFYDAAGTRLLETEMRRGQSFTVPADADGPMIRTARPEAFTITIGGRTVPPLATEMMTVADVKVDAASLLARPAPTAAATPAADAAATPAGADAADRPRNMAAPLRTTPISEGNAGSPVQRQQAARISAPRRTPVATPSVAAEQDAAAANAASAADVQADATAASPPPAAVAPASETASEVAE